MLNCFQTGQGPCVANLYIWSIAESAVCECGQQQTMHHVVSVSINKIGRQIAVGMYRVQILLFLLEPDVAGYTLACRAGTRTIIG